MTSLRSCIENLKLSEKASVEIRVTEADRTRLASQILDYIHSLNQSQHPTKDSRVFCVNPDDIPASMTEAEALKCTKFAAPVFNLFPNGECRWTCVVIETSADQTTLIYRVDVLDPFSLELTKDEQRVVDAILKLHKQPDHKIENDNDNIPQRLPQIMLNTMPVSVIDDTVIAILATMKCAAFRVADTTCSASAVRRFTREELQSGTVCPTSIGNSRERKRGTATESEHTKRVNL